LKPVVAAKTLAVRRFGAVNLLGLATLIRRETSRGLSDYNYQILGPVVTALLYLAIFRLALHSDATGAALLNFIAPGLIVFSACEKAYESAAGSFIFDKHERIIGDMLMAPLNAVERLIGYVAADCLGGLAVGAAVALVTLIFATLGMAQPWAILAFGALGMVLHALVGLLVGIWAEKWDQFSAVHTFLLVPLSFLSGVFYPIGVLPELAQSIMRWNPLFYVIDGFRFGVTGQAAADPGLGLAVLLGVDLLLGLIAYHWFRTGYRLKP
jgi:ABC-2 type transport system permease protein